MRRRMSRLILWWLIIILVLPVDIKGIVENGLWVGEAKAATTTLTNRIQWNQGEYNGIEADTSYDSIQLKASGVWEAREIKHWEWDLGSWAPVTATDGTYMYVLRGYGDNEFMKYIPSEDNWRNLPEAPHGVGAGAAELVGDWMYVLFSGGQTNFARFNIKSEVWEELRAFPELVSNGQMATDGVDTIYAIRGNTEVFKYTISTNTWSNMPAMTIANGYYDLVYYNGFLYHFNYWNSGNSTHRFFRYNVSNGVQTELQGPPVTFYNTNANASLVGSVLYIPRGDNTRDFYKVDLAVEPLVWTKLTDMPMNTQNGPVVYSQSEGLFYVFRGAGTRDIWKYNPTGNSFLGVSDLFINNAPVGVGRGSDLHYYNNNFYLLRGQNGRLFYNYNQGTQAWTQLASSPSDKATFYQYTRGVVVNGKIYQAPGGNPVTADFLSFDINAGSWAAETNYPVTTNESALGYPGSGDYLYSMRGAGQGTVYRYHMVNKTWEDAGATDLPTGVVAGNGAAMTSDGSNMYAILGLGNSTFYRYDGTTWTELARAPFTPYWGSDIAYTNGRIYAIPGQYDREFYEYNIASNSWRRLPQMNTSGQAEWATGEMGSLEADGSGNLYVTRGSGSSNVLKFVPDNANPYAASGSWTSGVIDLSYVSSFNSIAIDETIPDGGSLSVATRSSNDKVTWSSWSQVSEPTIDSPARRYLQVKVTMTANGDRTQTPKVNSITVDYTGDTTAPSNPTMVTGQSQSSGGTTISSGMTYSYPSPYFTWPAEDQTNGATDTETSVTGYYVYFGTQSDADPAALGSWQTTTNYLVTEPFAAGSYYLRIKTKNSAGLVSEASTLFTYVYTGIPADQSLTIDLTSEMTGVASDISNEHDELRLASRSGGVWEAERLRSLPFDMNWGTRTTAYLSNINGSRKIYAMRGSNSTDFYEYDLNTDIWTTLTASPVPVAVGAGGGIVEGPDNILYALAGNNTMTFMAYDAETGVWQDAEITDTPNIVQNGSSLVYDGTRYIYLLRGTSDDSFWRYDPLTNSWYTGLTPVDFGAGSQDMATTNYVGSGGDTAFDGTDTVYAIQGNSQASFSKYSINDGTWTVLPDVPVLVGESASIGYHSGKVFLNPGWWTPDFFLYDTGSQTWTRLGDMPAGLASGSDFKVIGDYMYVFATGRTWWKYHIMADSFQIPTRGIMGKNFYGTNYDTFNNGAKIIKGNESYFYISRGNYSNDFYRYNYDTGESIRLANLPTGSYNGTALAYDSHRSRIYYYSAYVARLFEYDIATDTWADYDSLPFITGNGSDLIYNPDLHVFYWTRGASNGFYEFNPTAQAGSRWTQKTNIPYMGLGGKMVYKNGFVYALRADASYATYRYDVGANTWNDAAMAEIPTNFRAYYGASLVDGGDGNLYYFRGENDDDVFKYSIEFNTWTQMTAIPAQITYGGAAASDGNGRIFVISGGGSGITFNDGLYVYYPAALHRGVQRTGTYTSQTHDLTDDVYQWSNIRLKYSDGNYTTLTVETRGSDDGAAWGNWTATSQKKTLTSGDSQYLEYKINSGTNRYIQVKFSMTSDFGAYTPVIDNYTINYFQDSQAPSNPLQEGFNAYTTSTASASLTTTTWSKFAAPYFAWADAEAQFGASDTATGSGVVGYYVYFDTQADADPAVDGALQSNENYTGSGLVSGEKYYLRIKTVDNAGNISEDVWQPFIYYFDNEAPDAPGDLTVDPSGYTATNSFDFSWEAATDSASLVKEYCYKTGATSGEWASERCANVLGLNDVPSYRTGVNVMYVRSKDNAGNFSAYAPVNFYYASTAPSPPTNLRVTPEENTENSFAFSWDPPAVYYGNQGNLRYYYSINALPTAVNTTETPMTSLAAGPFATLPGENTFYVVAKDEAGNINYSQKAEVTFTARTTAPGLPINMDIADVSVKATKSWKLAISWETPEDKGSGVGTYQVWRSADNASFSQIATTAGISYVDTGLTQVKYYYKVKACDNANNCGSFGTTVNYLPDGKWLSAATLTADPEVTGITTKKATISWSTNRTADSKVAYGVASGDYYDEEVANSEQVTGHELSLTNLTPGTKYYYICRWTDEDGNTGNSEELTFDTLPRPSAKEVKAVQISLDSAIIQFTAKDAAKAKVQYGKTSAFGSVAEISIGATESTHSIQLNGLADGVKYYYRVDLLDSEGAEYQGDIYSFETLPRPKLSNIKLQQVRGTATSTVLLTWNSNTDVSSIATYYPSANPSQAQDDVSVKLVKAHRAIIKGLLPDTVYTVVLKGRDKAGNEAVSEPQTFTTAMDTRPPEMSNLRVETTIQGVGEEATAQVIVSWDTDELSTSQVTFGEGSQGALTNKTQKDEAMTFNHLVVIPNLMPSKVYHLKAISTDKGDNESQSVDTVVITPKSTQSALNLVVGNLSQAFGFLGGLVEE